ncbi:MAG: hypothetical protein ACHREM_14110 [Polyangiales bacterium]
MSGIMTISEPEWPAACHALYRTYVEQCRATREEPSVETFLRRIRRTLLKKVDLRGEEYVNASRTKE